MADDLIRTLALLMAILITLGAVFLLESSLGILISGIIVGLVIGVLLCDGD